MFLVRCSLSSTIRRASPRTLPFPMTSLERLTALSSRQDLIDARLKKIELLLQARSLTKTAAPAKAPTSSPPPSTSTSTSAPTLPTPSPAPTTAALPEKKVAVVAEKKPEAGTNAPTKPQKAAAPKADEAPIDISRVSFKVGKIVSVERHPQADHLYIEQIDLGGEKPVQVCSGLAKFIPIEEMKDRLLVVIVNMKPTNFRGVRSEAMVLAAASDDGTKVELVDPPKGSAPGTPIKAAGYEGKPDEELNPKLKIFETVKPDLKSNGDKIACYKGTPLRTPQGDCTVKSLANSQLG